MTAKTYHLKTTDPILQQLLDSVDNKSKYLEDAVSHFSKCDIRDTEKNLKLEGLRLKNLKTTLEIFDGCKKHQVESPLAVVKGEKKLPTPELPEELEEIEPAPANVNRMCICGHEHVDTIPHVCSNKDCLCGIRG